MQFNELVLGAALLMAPFIGVCECLIIKMILGY
jgi:hypothetical protein